MSSHRARPFSGKKKKVQLQLKKKSKSQLAAEFDSEIDTAKTKATTSHGKPNLTSKWDVKESTSILPRMNSLYQTSIQQLESNWRETSFDLLFRGVSDDLTIPVRPSWSRVMSPTELEESEQIYFQSWLNETYQKVSDKDSLSYFEQNLEVWRQLWRVCEVSDVLLIVSDVRNPVLHLPPSFCHYVTVILNKPLIVVLTKADLVSSALRTAWASHLQSKFPKVNIYFVSIYPERKSDDGNNARPKRYIKATGVVDLFAGIQSLCDDSRFDDQWNKILTGLRARHESKLGGKVDLKSAKKIIGDLFTIGVIGQPNVGKSSLINSIFGHSVVSTSRTPGHTKHFQTLHLSDNIRLCDCPGLIFPSVIDRNLQILCGLYNVAQVKDPYGPLLCLAQRINLVAILKLPIQGNHSIFDVCDEFATKLGFFTSKSGRPDCYRSANYMLRMVVDGKILLNWVPPGFHEPSDDRPSVSYELLEESEEDTDEEDASDDEDSSVALLGKSFSLGSFSILADSE